MKKKQSEAEIDSWGKLADLIESYSLKNGIFRGEATKFPTLRPKAGRVGAEKGSSRKKPYVRDDEVKALELFKRQARPYLNHTPATDSEWLAVAQHHGMATRLLDWTESLLVAAYFASGKAGTSGSAVIYAIDGLHAISPQQESAPFQIDAVGIFRAPHITPRIPAQRSIFTIHPDPIADFATDKRLTRWVITKKACADIKRILDTCAINESSLFPDLDGLSRYIGWRYKWGK